MAVLVNSVASLAWLLVLAGFCGGLHPIGDSLAVFRVELSVVAALALIWTAWPRILRWGGAALLLALLGTHVWHGLDDRPQPGDLTLLQQNLLYHRGDGGAGALGLITTHQPDLITLQEVSRLNRPLLDALRKEYPAQQLCPVGALLGEAVLSRHPKIAGTGFCSARDGLAGMQVDTPQGALWLVSVHLNWPWPRDQAGQVNQLIPELEKLSGPIVIAGDFNAVAWSHSLARIARASQTVRQGPYMSTFHLPKLPLPIGIDHVLASADLTSSLARLDKQGSDHHGILAHIAWKKGE